MKRRPDDNVALLVALAAILKREPMDEYEAGQWQTARDIAAATGWLELLEDAARG
jgi:hypothetical protein